MNKTQLRQIFKRILHEQVTEFQTFPHKKAEFLQNTMKNLLTLIQQWNINSIAIYSSLKYELPCTELGQMIAQHQYKLALPLHEIESQYLKFCEYKQGDQLIDGHFKILVPKNQQFLIPDLVIVPLFVFDPNSLHRLGYGGGYYDKTIDYYASQKYKTRFIGLATEQLKHQIVETYETDKELDHVVTEKQLYSRVQ